MSNHRRVLVSFILACSVLGLVSPVHAIKRARNKPRQEAEYTFESALNRVARAESVSVVAEAAPMDANLTKAEFDGLVQGKTSAGERIEAIAARFDYSVKQRGRLYILLKRYSSPRDLPDLTIEECQVSFDNIARLMEFFQPSREQFPSRPYSVVSQTLYVSLTDEQRALYKEGMLRVNTLSSEQQEWVVFGALQNYFDTNHRKRILHASEDCRNATRTDATLTRLEPTVPAIVYWAAPKTATLDLENIFIPKELGEPQQSGTPEKEPPAVKPKEQFLYAISDALKRCSDFGNEDAAADPRIAAKRVTLVGGDFLRGTDFLSAAAEIYGLRVARYGSKLLLTVRAAPQQKPMIAQLVPALRRLLPSPVVRALHLEELDKIHRRLQRPDRAIKRLDDSTDIATKGLTEEARAARFRYLALPADYYETAIRQLCQRMADYQAKTSQEGFPVADLGEERGRLLANLLLWKLLGQDKEFFYGLPIVISSFDNLYLYGGPMRLSGEPSLGVGFITRSPSGTGSSSWGSTTYRVYESDPAFSLVTSQLGPPKPRRAP